MNPAIRAATIVLTILLGLCVGSFLNVVIYRLPLGMSLAKPASHCPKCNNPIKWYDNIPLLSYIFLRGKCRHCHEPISIRYPLVELTHCALWVLCMLRFTGCIIVDNPTNWLRFILSCLACSLFLAIFFCDLDHMEIPEVLLILLLAVAVGMLADNVTPEKIIEKVIGFLACGLLFILVNAFFRLFKKRDGLGFGDVELVASSGLLLGGYSMLFGLICSCVTGSIVLLILSIRKKEQGKEYPFAPFLVGGILLALFVGDFVVTWYLGLLGVHA